MLRFSNRLLHRKLGLGFPILKILADFVRAPHIYRNESNGNVHAMIPALPGYKHLHVANQ
jgi:hypothetical protein